MNLDATKNALSCSLSQLKTINFLKNINSLLDVIDKAFSLFLVHLFTTVIETFFFFFFNESNSLSKRKCFFFLLQNDQKHSLTN